MKRLIWLLLFCIAGCFPWSQATRPESPQRFSITLPDDWRKLNTQKYFIITKDGPFSQYILIQQRHVNESFGHTKKIITKDMPPRQLSEVIVDEIGSDPLVLNLNVIENFPARVNRYDGFRLVFTYQSQKGYKFRTIYYGFLQGEWFYAIRYNASEWKYCRKDLETLKRVIESFSIGTARRT